MRIIQSTVAVCTCRWCILCGWGIPCPFEHHTHTHTYTQNNLRIKWAISILCKLHAMNLLDESIVKRANTRGKSFVMFRIFRVLPLLASSVGIRLVELQKRQSAQFSFADFLADISIVLSVIHLCLCACITYVHIHFRSHNSPYRFHSMYYMRRWWRRRSCSHLFL